MIEVRCREEETWKKLMSSIEMALSSSGFRYIVYIKKKK